MVDYLNNANGGLPLEPKEVSKIVGEQNSDLAFSSYAEIFAAIEDAVTMSNDESAKVKMADMRNYYSKRYLWHYFDSQEEDDDEDGDPSSDFGTFAWKKMSENKSAGGAFNGMPASQLSAELLSECKDCDLRVNLAKICYYSSFRMKTPFFAANALDALRIGELESGDDWDGVFAGLFDYAFWEKDNPKEAFAIADLIKESKNNRVGFTFDHAWTGRWTRASTEEGKRVLAKFQSEIDNDQRPSVDWIGDGGHVANYALDVLSNKINGRQSAETVDTLWNLVVYYSHDRISGYFSDDYNEVAVLTLEHYMRLTKRDLEDIARDIPEWRRYPNLETHAQIYKASFGIRQN